jgi:hypothetical protein
MRVDFLVSGAGQLTVQGCAEQLGAVKEVHSYATINLRPYVNVHQFFSLRIEYDILGNSFAIFVNDRKILVKDASRWVQSAGQVGFVYESTNIANSFEVERLYVRPSIWEGIGNFERDQPE